MNILNDIFLTQPDAINKEGTKFWLDKDMTAYAKEKNLKNIKVFYMQNKHGEKTRAIIENNEYIYDSQLLESIAVKIDMLAMIKENNEKTS